MGTSRPAPSALVKRVFPREPIPLLTGAVLIAVSLLAWVQVISQARAGMGMGMGMGMDAMPRPQTDVGMPPAVGPAFSLAEAAAFVAGWGVMMTAMMLPSATPMLTLYSAVRRKSARAGPRGIPTALFALVYLAVWAATGIPIYLGGILLGWWASGSAIVAAALPYAVAAVLLAAGAYQFTPLKRVCLRACQSPLAFLMGRWRVGYRGTLALALDHARYCLGCCWALMLVLVAAGAMGLRWVLLIAALVFAEKLLPRGKWTTAAVGGALLALGLLVAIQPALAAALHG